VAIRDLSLRSLLLAALVGRAVAAEEGTAPAPPPGQPTEPVAPSQPAPPVAYDALFRLPHDSAPAPAQGGAALDRKRWEERFAAVRGELDGARASLAKAQTDLEALAHKTDSWQMAAPGAQPTSENSPVSYKLRQDIRQHREEVGRAERRLRELEVEASLAGVPPEWQKPAVHTDAAPAPPES
jgi:hypothetical protein